MNLDSDDFTLLGLPRRFTLDRSQLDAAWKALQSKVHPDRFAAEGAAAQRLAMQWAMRVNEAHQRLKDPLQRGVYLCELAGQSVQSESNTAMPVDFLMQQMQWRESLDEASAAGEVEHLAKDVQSHRRVALERLAQWLDLTPPSHDGVQAAVKEVRALMFMDRLMEEIDKRLQAYEDEDQA